MAFCSNCGKPYEGQIAFCPSCGQALGEIPAQPMQEPPVYNQPEQQTYAQPQQTYAQPQQTYAQPQQTYAQPQQTYVQPQQTYAQPQQAYAPYSASSQPSHSNKDTLAMIMGIVAGVLGLVSFITSLATMSGFPRAILQYAWGVGREQFISMTAAFVCSIVFYFMALPFGIIALVNQARYRKQMQAKHNVKTILGMALGLFAIAVCALFMFIAISVVTSSMARYL